MRHYRDPDATSTQAIAARLAAEQTAQVVPVVGMASRRLRRFICIFGRGEILSNPAANLLPPRLPQPLPTPPPDAAATKRVLESMPEQHHAAVAERAVVGRRGAELPHQLAVIATKAVGKPIVRSGKDTVLPDCRGQPHRPAGEGRPAHVEPQCNRGAV